MAGETTEQIEARRAALGQYAAVLGQFYDDLISQKLPSDLVGDLVQTWWESVLVPAEREFDADD